MKSLAANLSRKKPRQQRETISHFSGQDNNELHLSSLQSLAYPKGRPNDIAIHPIPGGYFESNTPTPAIPWTSSTISRGICDFWKSQRIKARKVARLAVGSFKRLIFSSKKRDFPFQLIS